MNGIDQRRRWLETVPQWPARIVFVVGIVKLMQAGVLWLRTATWKPQTGVGALAEFGLSEAKVNAWLVAPRSWIGLHKIAVLFLRWPAFVIYFIAAFLLAVAVLPVEDLLASERRRAEASRKFW